jgi:hypothetical protein
LDRPNGAGILEINQAQLQLAAGQFSETVNNSSSSTPPGSGTNVAGLTGWNLSEVTSSFSTSGGFFNRTYSYGAVTDHYYFDCNGSIADSFYLTSTLVWNRQNGRSSINNFELYLRQEDGTLIASSESSVDNVEHLYQRHLPPGRYVLSVHRPAFSIQDGGDSTTETYALAFNFAPAPSPGAPGSLSATAVSSSQINLSWTDTSDDETNYRIERRIGPDSYSTIATLAADSTSYSDTGLASGTTYEYRVTAFNAEAETSASASATTDAAPPAAPSDATATAISTSEIDISWSDNSLNEDGFLIERRIAGGSYTNLVSLGADSTSYGDTGLNDGTLYEYRITAFNGSGSSGGVTADDATTLAPPSGAGATTLSDSEIQVTWTDNSASESGYRIERSLAGADDYTVVETLAADSIFYNDSSLSAATGYDYRITAISSITDDST